MKRQYSIYQDGNIDESCDGVRITVETTDYHANSAAIYARAIAELSEFLPKLSQWLDHEGKEIRKVGLEIRDFTDRENPMGHSRELILQNHEIYEPDNKA